MIHTPASTIIVAEPSTTMRRIIKMLLESSGRTIIETTSGAETLKALERTRAQLAILNEHLDDTGGLALCGEIRRRGDLQGVKILLLLHRSSGVTPEAAITSGADGSLSKPFLSAELEGALGRLLGEGAAPVVYTPKTAAPEPPGRVPRPNPFSTPRPRVPAANPFRRSTPRAPDPESPPGANPFSSHRSPGLGTQSSRSARGRGSANPFRDKPIGGPAPGPGAHPSPSYSGTPSSTAPSMPQDQLTFIREICTEVLAEQLPSLIDTALDTHLKPQVQQILRELLETLVPRIIEAVLQQPLPRVTDNE